MNENIKEKPMIFMTETIQAIRAGHKTMFRRVCGTGKQTFAVGDVLYVREAWARVGSKYYYLADGGQRIPAKWQPATTMPREASRTRLRVTNVRREKLQEITEEDCIKEGIDAPTIQYMTKEPIILVEGRDAWEEHADTSSATGRFKHVWDFVHSHYSAEHFAQARWSQNPEVWVVEYVVEEAKEPREKVLTLPIKKQWFTMIKDGIKLEEYREIKPYWTTRFLDLFGANKRRDGSVSIASNAAKVVFQNGYSANAPTLTAEVSCSIGCGRPEWGAEEGQQYYVLTIHRILD